MAAGAAEGSAGLAGAWRNVRKSKHFLIVLQVEQGCRQGLLGAEDQLRCQELFSPPHYKGLESPS